MGTLTEKVKGGEMCMLKDSEIVDLYWKRSQDAIAQSDLRYGRYCHSIAYRILYSQEDSEECVNDTWMQAWKVIPPQRPVLLKAFLGKITRNLALNRYEASHAQFRGGGQTAACLDELDECIPDNRREEDIADRMTLTDCLNTFLGELGEEERIIFLRRYWYECSVKEIAQGMNLGESKVKMTLMRTRNKLREYLEKEGVQI